MLDPICCRTAEDLRDVISAVVTGGNDGMWDAQANHGVTAIWGQDGVITFRGIMVKEINAANATDTTVNPHLEVTATTSSEDTTETTEARNDGELREVTTVSSTPTTVTDTTGAGRREDRVTHPIERAITRDSGSDKDKSSRVWVFPTTGQTEIDGGDLGSGSSPTSTSIT